MTRLRQSVSSLAIVTVLATAPLTAFAAGEETSADTGAEATIEGDANMEAEGTATAEGDVAAEGEAVAEEEPVRDVKGTIVLQGENSVLAKDLLGASVYNMSDESIGDISDMIVSLDGKVEGVVIGVGGFLGIGEKKVAVELASISLQADEDASPRLYLDATTKDLEAADEFVTAQKQQQLEEMKEAQEAAEEAADNALEDNTALE